MASPQTLIALALLLIAGCQTSQRARYGEKVAAPDFSERELRLRLGNYMNEFAGTIERSADAVLMDTDDPRERYAAITWKIGAVSAGVGAALQPDPVVSLMDLWVLLLQLRQFAAEGPGKDLLGTHQPAILFAVDHLVARIGEFQPYLPGKDTAATVEEIENWAAQHPIEPPFLARRSPAADLAKAIGDPKLTLFGTVQTLGEQVGELMARLQLYVLLLPRQVRWQAEFVAEQVGQDERMQTTLADFDVMAASLDRLATIEDRLPDIIERHKESIARPIREELDGVTAEVERMRVETLASVRSEREAVLADVERQRTDTIAALRGERETILDAVDEQLQTALEAVRQERATILESVDRQRTHTLEEAEKLTHAALDASQKRAQGLIRDFFLGAFLAGAALIVVASLARLLLRRLAPAGARAR